jgi:Rrf2 family protein
MKLSTRARYGLRALAVLASGDTSRTSESIAKQEDLSKKYMDEILGTLRRGGLLRTKRGVSGGYQLEQPASEISILQVVEMLDGPTALAPCTQDSYDCVRAGNCKARPLWHALNNSIRQALGTFSLQDVVDGGISQLDCIPVMEEPSCDEELTETEAEPVSAS